MKHPDAFFTRILQRPDDNEPRLAYADWLDQHCDPLGEFIRIQIRLSGGAAAETHFWELEQRDQELLAEFEEQWVGDLPGRVAWWVFCRGFVEEMGLSTRQYLDHGSWLFANFPLQTIHLDVEAGSLPALADSTALGQARYLDLSNNRLGDQGVGRLVGSAHLAGVQGLNMSSTCLGNAGVEALADSPHVAGLRELYLSNNRINTAGARALAATPYLSQLNQLYLDGNILDQEGENLLRRRFGPAVHLR